MTGRFEDLSFVLSPLEHFFCDFLERAYSGRLPTCNVDPPSISVQLPRSGRSRCIVKPRAHCHPAACR